jgi:hypothetical protein
MSFQRFNFDEANGAIIAFRDDDTAYVCLAEQIRHFSQVQDRSASLDVDTVIAALDHAWTSNQQLFRKLTPRAPLMVSPISGMAMEITAADRVRLHNIIDKHHKRYFPDWPTPAQKDNLIDALGPVVAAKIVKDALASNRIN